LILGSATGLLSSSLWDICINELNEVVCNCSNTPAKEIVLLTDNLGIHCQPESISDALNHDLYQIYFPPNCSHFVQPLDNILFAGLKRKIYKISSSLLCEALFWEKDTVNLQELILTAVLESFPTIFSTRNIQKAWDNVGVYPFDSEKLLKRASQNVGKVKFQKVTSEKNALALEAKNALESFHKEYEVSSELQKQKVRQVSISTNWGESGSTGIKILENVEKKRRLDEENEEKKEKEKEQRLLEKQAKDDEKKKEKEKREKEKKEKLKRREKEKKMKQKRKEKKALQKEKEKEKKEKGKERERKERENEKKFKKRHQCKVENCIRKWMLRIHEENCEKE